MKGGRPIPGGIGSNGRGKTPPLPPGGGKFPASPRPIIGRGPNGGMPAPGVGPLGPPGGPLAGPLLGT